MEQKTLSAEVCSPNMLNEVQDRPQLASNSKAAYKCRSAIAEGHKIVALLVLTLFARLAHASFTTGF
ncbi:MAG TPA: hypothetical protein VHG71_06605 [Verrucomicrobiae bacterium]|nr:hypothetical protein [Verrucomicrobiae bacterium]